MKSNYLAAIAIAGMVIVATGTPSNSTTGSSSSSGTDSMGSESSSTPI